MTIFIKTKTNINNIIRDGSDFTIDENGEYSFYIDDINKVKVEVIDEHTMKFSRKTDEKRICIHTYESKDKHITVCPGAFLTIDIESLRNSFLNAQIATNANVTILNSSVVWYTYNGTIYKNMSIVNSIAVLNNRHIDIPVNIKNDAIIITNNTVRKFEDIHIEPTDGDTILVMQGAISFKDHRSYESKSISKNIIKYDFGIVKDYTKHTQKLISIGSNCYCRNINTFNTIVDHDENGVEFEISNESYRQVCNCDHSKDFVIYGAKYAYVQQGLGFNFVIFIGNNDLVLERIDCVVIGKTEYELRYMHKIGNKSIEPIKFEKAPYLDDLVITNEPSSGDNEVTFIDYVVEKLEYYKRYSRRFNYCDEKYSYHYTIFNFRNKVLRVKKSGIVFTSVKSLLHTILDINAKENSIMILSEYWISEPHKSDFNEKVSMLLMKHIMGYSDIRFAHNFKYTIIYQLLSKNNSNILDELVEELYFLNEF